MQKKGPQLLLDDIVQRTMTYRSGWSVDSSKLVRADGKPQATKRVNWSPMGVLCLKQHPCLVGIDNEVQGRPRGSLEPPLHAPGSKA